MLPAAGGLPLAVRIGGQAGERAVDFPLWQPRRSAIVGYLGEPGDRYVLTVLKVPELRSALRDRLREPRSAALLRRLPLEDSSYAPTRLQRSRIERVHALCRPWLRDLDQARARALLTGVVPELGARQRDALLDGFFAERQVLQLTPDVSCLVDVDFPQLGPAAVPALYQRAVTGGPYRLAIRSGRAGQGIGRAQGLPFLLLLAVARRIALAHTVGLDLGARLRGRCLVFPGVLTSPGSPDLAYVDFFGWTTPLGNVAQRLGYRLGYGERGPGRWLLRTVARRAAAA